MSSPRWARDWRHRGGNPLFRLPFFAALAIVFGVLLYLGGASLGMVMGSVGFIAVFGAILAVFVILAQS